VAILAPGGACNVGGWPETAMATSTQKQNAGTLNIKRRCRGGQ
jgi:hypothetical protein